MSRAKLGVSFVEPEEMETTRRDKSMMSLGDQSRNVGNKSMYSVRTLREQQWKKPTRTSYETMVLTKSEFNSKVRGAGFRSNGKARHIKKTCLLSKIY